VLKKDEKVLLILNNKNFMTNIHIKFTTKLSYI
jgi:hypothetical protein